MNLEEQPRDTIVVTKTVEVFEYDNVTTDNTDGEKVDEEGSGGSTTMIIIIASVIGVLLLVIGAMIVRVILKKRSVETLSAQKID